MATKRFLTTWLITSVVIFALNGVFHGLVAADFFDKNTAVLGSAVLKMADFKPLPVAVLELIISFSLTWILFKTSTESTTLNDALTIGGLVHFATSATWNLANMATFVAWPLQLVLGDVSWHILMGIVSGWLIFKIGLRKKT